MKKFSQFFKAKKQQTANPERRLLSVVSGRKGKGSLHRAADAGDLEKLKQLAQNNDINQLDKNNRTALYLACASGHVEVVQFLLESKANVNLCDNQNTSALMKAVQCKHEQSVKVLLEKHAEPNLVDDRGNAALHFAASVSSVATAALLLEHGAEIDTQNKEGLTPLAVAVREDHIQMAELLQSEGANVNLVDHNKRSPLMMAASNRQVQMIELLLRFDPDTSLKDNKGWSAEDYAMKSGLHLLSALMAKRNTEKNREGSFSHRGESINKKNTHLNYYPFDRRALTGHEDQVSGTKPEPGRRNEVQRSRHTTSTPRSNRAKSSPQPPQPACAEEEDTEDELSDWDSDSSDLSPPGTKRVSSLQEIFAIKHHGAVKHGASDSSPVAKDKVNVESYRQQQKVTSQLPDVPAGTNNILREGSSSEENEILKQQLEDARRNVGDRDQKLAVLESDLAVTTTCLENQRKAHKILLTEVESTHVRLVEAVKIYQEVQRDTEGALQREKEEHQRLKDRLTGEAASLLEASRNLPEKPAKPEADTNKDSVLDALQQKKDQAVTRVKELEEALRAERELVRRARAQLGQARSKALSLQQQREETQNSCVKMRFDCDQRVELVEEKNRELASMAADLRDQIHKLEAEKKQREVLLEKEKGELSTQIETAKSKTGEVEDYKGILENRLDLQMMRNTELQHETDRLRTSLRIAEMKLLDLDLGGSEPGSNVSSPQRYQGRPGQAEGAAEQIKDKMPQEREVSHRSRREEEKDLKDHPGAQKNFKPSYDDLERSMKQMDEAVLNLRQRVEASKTGKRHWNQHFQEKSRQEVKDKMDQLNLYLRSEATSRESWDKIKVTAEANLRAQLEQMVLRFREQNLHLDRYKRFSTEERRLRRPMGAALERTRLLLIRIQLSASKRDAVGMVVKRGISVSL